MQYIYCLLSICIPLCECFRSESNSETLRRNIRWIILQKLFTGTVSQLFFFFHFRCSIEFEYHSADSNTLSTFSKSQAADLFVN